MYIRVSVLHTTPVQFFTDICFYCFVGGYQIMDKTMMHMAFVYFAIHIFFSSGPPVGFHKKIQTDFRENVSSCSFISTSCIETTGSRRL